MIHEEEIEIKKQYDFVLQCSASQFYYYKYDLTDIT